MRNQNLWAPTFLPSRIVLFLSAVAGLIFAASSAQGVTNGTAVVDSAEAPWLVLVDIDNIGTPLDTCGGIVVDPEWVLTISDCFQGTDSTPTTNGACSLAWIVISQPKYGQLSLIHI